MWRAFLSIDNTAVSSTLEKYVISKGWLGTKWILLVTGRGQALIGPVESMILGPVI